MAATSPAPWAFRRTETTGRVSAPTGRKASAQELSQNSPHDSFRGGPTASRQRAVTVAGVLRPLRPGSYMASTFTGPATAVPAARTRAR